MCAVCFNGLQVVPVAAVAARAWWARGRDRDAAVDDVPTVDDESATSVWVDELVWPDGYDSVRT